MSRWPARRGHDPDPVEPPAWFRVFVPEDWARPGDDEVRYPAGARMDPVTVARHRWVEARREWCAAHPGFSFVDWLQQRRRERLGARTTGDPPRARGER